MEQEMAKQKEHPVEPELDLEVSLKKIEEIIGALEQPEVTLADALKLYKEGVLLAAQCKEAITDVEKEIQVLETRED